MNVIIVEDENRAGHQLEKMIRMYDSTITILAQLPSVRKTVEWFLQNPAPDLAFMDIHLEDGEAFSIFQKIPLKVPVIFTTAYDEYMLKAFRLNTIDYLLKPIEFDEMVRAIEKFRSLRNEWIPDYKILIDLIQQSKNRLYRERFMVSIGAKIHSLEIANTAFFYSEEKSSFLVTKNGLPYPMDYSLDQLGAMLDPTLFFRVNRQYLVSRQGIKAIYTYSPTKIKVELEPDSRQEVFVSVNRIPEFKDWLGR